MRHLGPVPWFREGYKGLAVHAAPSVPIADDPIIRGALVRAVLTSNSLARLETAVNRELRPLGYVATLHSGGARRGVVHVEIAKGAEG